MANRAISAGRDCTPGWEGYLAKLGEAEAFLCLGPIDPFVNPLGARATLELPGK